MMKHFGLVGFPLGHSFSKRYFDSKFRKEGFFDCDFFPFELQCISEIRDLVNTKNLKGFSVTIPHKESIIPYLDLIDPVALEIGAVNSVKVERTDDELCLIGFNTDWIGFKKALEPKLSNSHKKALILGTGGAAKAVAYALKSLGIEYHFVSRDINKGLAYCDIDKRIVEDNLIIVNTTPLGTFPNVNEKADFPTNLLTENHIVYDLIYNPVETLLLKEARLLGAKTINGQRMLEEQAEVSWIKWNG